MIEDFMWYHPILGKVIIGIVLAIVFAIGGKLIVQDPARAFAFLLIFIFCAAVVDIFLMLIEMVWDMLTGW